MANASAAAEAASQVEIPEALQKQKLSESISYELVSERKVEFTQDLARKIIELPEFVGERPLRDGHVAFLVSEMKKGTFLPDIAALVTCICEWDGVERRLNGQHTSWARTYMPDKWDIKIKLVKYSAPTEEDFRRLYSAIDRGAPRTPAHVLFARVLGNAEFKGIGTPILRLLGTGLRYHVEAHAGQGSNRPDRKTVDQIADLMETQYLTQCQTIAGFMQTIKIKPDNKHVWRGPVFGAMFGTFSKNVEKSIEFWTAVATGVGIDSMNDPRGRLRTLLMQSAVACGAGSRGTRKTFSQEDMLRLCIYCWNQWRNGDEVKCLRVPEKRPTAK